MNPWFLLLCLVLTVVIVMFAYMTPHDRRLVGAILLDTCDRIGQEVHYQFGRARNAWEDWRESKKAKD